MELVACVSWDGGKGLGNDGEIILRSELKQLGAGREMVRAGGEGQIGMNYLSAVREATTWNRKCSRGGGKKRREDRLFNRESKEG